MESLSRRHVDRFWEAHRGLFRGRVLDVGGSRVHRYGKLDVFAGPWQVVVVNPNPAEFPDICGPGETMPGEGETYDVVRLSEVLEHVRDPVALLKEMRRVLTPDGDLLATVPFIYRIHGADDDWHRFTPARLIDDLEATGFRVVSLVALGGIYSTVVDLIAQWGQMTGASWRRLMPRLSAWALRREAKLPKDDRAFLWPLHWGVHARVR